jgi:hypothetical protein
MAASIWVLLALLGTVTTVPCPGVGVAVGVPDCEETDSPGLVLPPQDARVRQASAIAAYATGSVTADLTSMAS